LSSTILVPVLLVLAVFIVLLYWIFRPKRLAPLPDFKDAWRATLEEKVNFYRELNEEEKKRFRDRMRDFLRYVKITGIETEITELDKVYVAASGIIPTFGFPQWNQYPKLEQVLLYKTSFRQGDFATTGTDRRIAGMVGGRPMVSPLTSWKTVTLFPGWR